MSVEVLAVEKYYGKQKALDKVGFIIEKPQVVALLGPNGAGKSTLMKIMTTYLRPDGGTVYVNGYSVTENPMDVRKQVGYLPEHNPLYTDMYVFEYLEFIAGLYGANKKNIREAVEKTGLLAESHKKIGRLSKGYRQRVGLSAAILHNPSVLILDEPTTGLDPNQVVEIRNLIKELSHDKIIILSTHIMQEVQKIADRVLILDRAQLIADKPVEDIQQTSGIILLELDLKVEPALFNEIKQIHRVENLGGNTWELLLKGNEDIRSAVFDWAVKHQLKILRFEMKNTDLENYFRKHTSSK